MVSEAAELTGEVAQEMGYEMADTIASWHLGSRTSLWACQRAVLKTSSYVTYMNSCEITKDCYRAFTAYYTPAAEWATRRISEYFCDLGSIEKKIAELYSLSKGEKDATAKEALKEDIKTLKNLKKEFIRLFGDKIKEKNMKLEDKKHLAGSKTYKHAEPAPVHVEEEEVTA